MGIGQGWRGLAAMCVLGLSAVPWRAGVTIGITAPMHRAHAAGSLLSSAALPRGTITTVGGDGAHRDSGDILVAASRTAVGSAQPASRPVARAAKRMTWITRPSEATMDLRGISCPSTHKCVAVGSSGTIVTSADGGATWTSRTTGIRNELTSVSCPSVRVCVAVGAGVSLGQGISSAHVILTTADGGATWTSKTYAGLVFLQSVSCPSTHRCVAVGDNLIQTSADDGSTWTYRTWDNNHQVVNGVNCPSVHVCVAVGINATIVTSADGGATGTNRPHPLSASYETLNAVSCASVRACVAVGSTWDSKSRQVVGIVLTSRNGGVSWARASNLAGDLSSVSCPSTKRCVAVGNGGTIQESTDGGGIWRKDTVGVSILLSGISCARVSVCVAVGEKGTILQGRS